VLRTLRRTLPLLTLMLLLLQFFPAKPYALAGQSGAERNYTGSIDNKYEIEMTLKRQGSSVEGSYFYTRTKKPIHLKGSIDASGNVTLEETSTAGAATAAFKGRFVSDGVLTGIWAKLGAKSDKDSDMPFTVELQTMSGQVVGADDRALVRQSEVLLKHAGPRGKSSIEGGFKEAKVRYPIVSGLNNQAALAKVQAALSLNSTVGESLEQLTKEFIESPELDGIDYKVNYNRDYILDVTITRSGTGAYPDSQDFDVVLNLKTGEKLKATDIFKSTAINSLVARLNQQLKAYIKETIEEQKKQGEDVASVFPSTTFEEKDISNVSIGDTGITFLFSFGFPHALQALEPAGEFVFPYEQLKNDLDPKGLLGARLQ
jgi:hypothetical protein